MSHQATEDIAIMRALPNVVVMAPGDAAEFGIKKGIGAPPDDGTHFGDHRTGLALHQFKVAVTTGFHGYLGDFGLYPNTIGKEVSKALFEVPLKGVKVYKFHVHTWE